MEDNPTAASRQRLADYLYDQATWRYNRTRQHSNDAIDERTIEGLRTLASHVNGLHDTDERLYVLAALDINLDEVFRPGREADRLTRGYLINLRNESPDAWFSRFIDALARDRGEDTDVVT